MRVRYLTLVVAAAALTQASCAIGFRGEARRPVSPPVMVLPTDPVRGRLEPTPAPDVAPPIPPVAPR